LPAHQKTAFNKKIIVAIDGFSGCGKSTLAKGIASKLNYTYIDSGAMYRAVALFAIRNNIDVTQSDNIVKELDNIEISLEGQGTNTLTFLNGEDVTLRGKDPKVSAIVSEVAAIPEVRFFLRRIQQDIGIDKGIVMDGRDIGTVIFPDAELKLYIIADIDVRAQRRRSELEERGLDSSIEEIKNNLAKRDHIDSSRLESPLMKAEDAIIIDTTGLSRKEQLNTAMGLVSKVVLV